MLLVAHVATLPLGALIPFLGASWTIVLLAVGFAGIAISANNRQNVIGTTGLLVSARSRS